jgi:hypothetical protein
VVDDSKKAWSFLLILCPWPNVFSLIEITSGGLILGQNPDKNLKSFPPCCSPSPIHDAACPSVIADCTGERRKNLIENHAPLPYGLRNLYRNPQF